MVVRPCGRRLPTIPPQFEYSAGESHTSSAQATPVIPEPAEAVENYIPWSRVVVYRTGLNRLVWNLRVVASARCRLRIVSSL